MKQLTPVRLIKNAFCQQVLQAEANCADNEMLKELLGRARAKKGMFEGDMEQGELEVGQISGLINEILPASVIVKEIIEEFNLAKSELNEIIF